MRNVAKVLMLSLGWAAMAANGIAQSANSAGADEIRRYEVIVQQPVQENNGMAWWKLAVVYRDAARYADAERAYLKARDLLRSGDQTVQANLIDQLGMMYVEMGRYAEADGLEQEALAMRETQRDSLGVGLSWMHLAMLSLGERRNADGETYAELAVERLVPEQRAGTEQGAATPEQKMTALIYLSLARCAAHDCADALSPLKRAATIAEKHYPKESFPVAYIQFLEGYAGWKRGDKRSAATLMKNGTTGMEAQLGWGHPTYISAMRQYASFLEEAGRESEATEVRRKLARLPGLQPAAQSASAGEIPAMR